MKDNINSEVNAILKEMHNQEATAKGSVGEVAVTKICEEFYQKYGGILYHSYEYKVDKDLPGNIKRTENGLYVEKLGSITEIDVLLVTPFRVFPIEVKAYKATRITLKDDGIYGCRITDKSPVHQNEMHCRHLYSHIFKSLPEGSTEYIVPIVCLVDKAEVIDMRSKWQKEYIKVCILNTLKDTLVKNNTPLDYKINLNSMYSTLNEVSTNYEKCYPVRL